MFVKLIKRVLSLFTLFVAMSACADVIVDNLNQITANYFGSIGTDSNTNDFLIGQEFALPSGTYKLDKITLLLNPTNGNGNITASIWNAGPDNNPTNEIAVVSSQLVTNVGNVDFVPSTTITLQSGNYYVVAAPTTSADNALVSWAYTSSTNWTGFGILGGYADTIPGSWENSPITYGPQQMSVEATPTIQISRNGSAIVLSWPSSLSGYAAESTTNLVSPNWQTITNTPVLVASNNTITNIWTDQTRFFRLRQSFIVDNLNQTTAGYFGTISTNSNDTNFLIGQEFTLPSGNYSLDKITLLLNPTNGHGNISVSIYGVGPDNNPTNQIAFVASQSVTNLGNVDFVPSTSIILPSGTYYVVTTPTTAADGGLVSWAFTDSTDWIGAGTLDGYADTIPGSWENSPITDGPQQLSVQATPAPP
jgi:uncharacterized protein YlzI (FlbEa/FlbD family)